MKLTVQDKPGQDKEDKENIDVPEIQHTDIKNRA